VFRIINGRRLAKDIIGLQDESIKGQILLKPVMKNGKRLQPPESLEAIRQRFKYEFSRLADDVKAIERPGRFPVEISPELENLQNKVIHRVIEKELGES
jgi:nicotinate phosphoribosyltransferase